jgi:hypothetical protein
MSTVQNTVENVLIGFKITSWDSLRRTINLTVTLTYPDGEVNSKQYKRMVVSPLLAWRLNDKPEQYVGISFTSVIASINRKENPFQLIKCRKNGEDHMFLALVQERKSKEIKTIDPNGKVLIEYERRYHNREHYRRYRSYSPKQTTEVTS